MFTVALVDHLVRAFVAGFESAGRMPHYGLNDRGQFTIVTCEPQDLSRSSNGGDYRFWWRYSPRLGKVQEFSSCDFWQPRRVFRFRPMSRRNFMRHVRVARRLAERLHRRGVQTDVFGLFIPDASLGGKRVSLR